MKSLWSVCALPPFVGNIESIDRQVSGILKPTFAMEVSARGVWSDAIALGRIEPKMMRKALAVDPERSPKTLRRTSMGYFGTAEDAGRAAAYLCSPMARFVTGIVLRVDGGGSMGF